jgi:hypothetical protein
MKSQTTRKFRELFASLPARVKKQTRQSYRLFQNDPAHPGLHFKQVFSDPPTYSARVGISYRVVGVLDGDTITWFWIGSHAEYNKVIERL